MLSPLFSQLKPSTARGEIRAVERVDAGIYVLPLDDGPTLHLFVHLCDSLALIFAVLGPGICYLLRACSFMIFVVR